MKTRLTIKQKIARKLSFRLLNNLQRGTLTIVFNGKTSHFIGKQDQHLEAHITIANPETFNAFIFGGDVASAEAYIMGWWKSEDLSKLMHLFALNNELFLKLDKGTAFLQRIINKLSLHRKKNSLKQAKSNILAHYDLGNELFNYFLDPTMMYSSAVFPNQQADLEQAQHFKLAIICEKLRLKASDHVLEIGSGWGGLAIYMAKHYHCNITTTTISENQYRYVLERIKKEKLSDKIKLYNIDYRNLTGHYDKLVSIEMIEAVGKKYLPIYFKQCSKLLKDNGVMLLQTITTTDQHYKNYVKTSDFIREYIFPGGHLPSLTVIQNILTNSTNLYLIDLQDLTPHYAKTLNSWRKNFNRDLKKLGELGYDEYFQRMWNYYLTYCEGGFVSQTVRLLQCLIAKPSYQHHQGLRAY